MSEVICELHGPYDAALGACPYCKRSTRRISSSQVDWDMNDIPTMMEDGDLIEKGSLSAPSFGADRQEYYEALHNTDRAGTLGIFWVKTGSRRGHIYLVRHGDVIGREHCEIELNDTQVSPLHAKMTFEDGQFFIWDFASDSGTYVNGQRIRAATALNDNDVIKIGATSFVMKILEQVTGDE
jgi:hypothetical protein